MSPAKKRARTYDPDKTRAAVLAQLGNVREAVHGLTPEQLALPTRVGGRTVRELAGQIEALPAVSGDQLVARCVELVGYTDDLAAATGVEIPYDRQALATATRLLADALAAAAPGGSVEVRVPPFAVVQCVEGPRHTRGTPPNIVETDPLTWMRLATGRTTWDEALDAASLSASGERADLGPYLPVRAFRHRP
ncbi:sterol carrier family protein [Streptomyces sp. NPDC001339]|uniref:sterol carrier family protein n=1 Tax=Streptomyces sp. NPDC001339 TaxID=3364563 RepID=UPI0036A78CB9